MPAIITTPMRSFNIKQNREAFSEIGADRLYLFVGKTGVWTDEESPPVPVETNKEIFDAYRNMIGLKLVGESNMVTVCRRFDWTLGEVYDQFDDTLNMTNGFLVDDTTFPVFYVLTDEFNVYKCIDNNGGAASTVKPTGNSLSSFETTDGYIWKFMYSLKSADVFNFLTTNWMPVVTLDITDGSTQWTVQQNAVPGSVEAVILESGGLGYSSTTLPIVTVTGDGTGAEALAEVDAVTGEILRIRMTSIGQDYTYANVSVDPNGSGGAGAVARAVMSPPGGHGSDAVNELGGYFELISAKLEDDEGGKIPTGIDFRQIGLIVNPKSTANGKRLVLSGYTGVFEIGDVVSGQTSDATGTVVGSSDVRQWIDVQVTSGVFTAEDIVSGVKTATVSYTDDIDLPLTALAATSSEIKFGSGQITYLENRVKITRNAGQNELIKFVIEG